MALLVPILAGLLGLFSAFRMMRLPDTKLKPPSCLLPRRLAGSGVGDEVSARQRQDTEELG